MNNFITAFNIHRRVMILSGCQMFPGLPAINRICPLNCNSVRPLFSRCITPATWVAGTVASACAMDAYYRSYYSDPCLFKEERSGLESNSEIYGIVAVIFFVLAVLETITLYATRNGNNNGPANVQPVPVPTVIEFIHMLNQMQPFK